MDHPFIKYLVDQDLVSPQAVATLNARNCLLREPIGMIAVSHGLLDPLQIDSILDRQRDSAEKSRFGEIATELGFLTAEQVDVLIKIQEFRTIVAITEALALAGVLKYEDAVRYQGAYFVKDDEILAMLAEE